MSDYKSKYTGAEVEEILDRAKAFDLDHMSADDRDKLIDIVGTGTTRDFSNDFGGDFGN